jgi:hypothetical protein
MPRKEAPKRKEPEATRPTTPGGVRRFGLREVAMLRKRKEPKAKKSVAEALLRDMQGTAAEKLALFEKLKARGGFDGEDRRELLKVERMLRTFAASEQSDDREDSR